MAESAKKVAQRAEGRLDRVAEDVRARFDRITGGRFSDKIKNGRFAQAGHGVDQGRGESGRREQGRGESGRREQGRAESGRREQGGSDR